MIERRKISENATARVFAILTAVIFFSSPNTLMKNFENTPLRKFITGINRNAITHPIMIGVKAPIIVPRKSRTPGSLPSIT